MLFNSFEFVLIFLPAAFAGFFWIARYSHRLAALWLAAASLSFYGWWNPKLVLLLLCSIAFNYAMGYAIGHARRTATDKRLLVAAVAANLACLGYFKYTNFFISSVNTAVGTDWGLATIALPLGISFFTFTQIAFLVDVYRRLAREYDFIHYILFVAYFPHLIAGPVLHHKQMMPQFALAATYRPSAQNVAIGLLMFAIGLAKKTLLADSFAGYATPIFNAANQGAAMGVVAAWTGALAYTLQIYFDFSGYSDMAIGLSRLFGIGIPLNFNSPYKAYNIIEFWRRWHMTLSIFLRDYLYISLGGNRQGTLRRYFNLMITMLLGGLWHGANWTFFVWGGLHGVYLVVNHAWHAVRRRAGFPLAVPSLSGQLAGTALTFLAVVVAWVFFRADTFASAMRMLQGMAAFGEPAHFFSDTGAAMSSALAHVSGVPRHSVNYFFGLFGAGLAISWLVPNSQTLVARVRLDNSTAQFMLIGSLLFWILVLVTFSASRGVSEFIYYNF